MAGLFATVFCDHQEAEKAHENKFVVTLTATKKILYRRKNARRFLSQTKPLVHED